MKIPPSFINVIAFLCFDENGTKVPFGTAYFVEIEEPDRSASSYYLVTARHCIDEIPSPDIYVRINTQTKLGPPGFEDVRTDKNDWFLHKTADVAAIISPHNTLRHDVERVPIDKFVEAYRFQVSEADLQMPAESDARKLADLLKAEFPDGIEVETGDELFSPGLFVQSSGQKRNLPVVRFGHIARMPGDELISLETQSRGEVEIRAYLAETHSWGGYSGSPVFWIRPYDLSYPLKFRQPMPLPSAAGTPAGQLNIVIGRGSAIALLGLVSGHFDIPKEAKDKKDQTIDDVFTDINSGMAIITPADNIRELLMEDKDVLKDRAQRLLEKRKKRPVATPDLLRSVGGRQLTTPKQGNPVEIPIPTEKQFTSDLGKLMRRKPPQS